MIDTDLRDGQVCTCGVKHQIPVKAIDIGIGAIDRIPECLSGVNLGKQAVIVADTNTWEAAGKRTQRVLENSGYMISITILPGEPQLKPDEKAVARVLADTKDNPGFLIAVGSGTINDLTRYAAHVNNKKYVSVATAPSMDGYASVISALLINGVKKTFYANPPSAIIADTGVIANAPKKMIAAGVGDMLAKIVSLADWKLGIAIMDEQWCSVSAQMSMDARDSVLRNIHAISELKTEGIQVLTEALINSGMAIIMAGHTRPASGGEHHIAHFIEMKLALEGLPEIMHGLKAGFGTLCSIACYNHLSEISAESIDISSLVRTAPDDDAWKQDLKKVFGAITEEILRESDPVYRDVDTYQKRLEKIKSVWNSDVKPILNDVPRLKEVLNMIRAEGFDYSPENLGLTAEMAGNAVKYACEVRPRYTVLRLMTELGLLDRMSEIISKRGFEKWQDI